MLLFDFSSWCFLLLTWCQFLPMGVPYFWLGANSSRWCPLLLAWPKSKQKLKAYAAGLLRSLRSLCAPKAVRFAHFDGAPDALPILSVLRPPANAGFSFLLFPSLSLLSPRLPLRLAFFTPFFWFCHCLPKFLSRTTEICQRLNGVLMPFKWCLNRGLVFSMSWPLFKKVVCFLRKGRMLFGKR